MVATASTEHSYWLAVAFVAWNFHAKNASVSCCFRLRNARNASDCVWMETGLQSVSQSINDFSVWSKNKTIREKVQTPYSGELDKPKETQAIRPHICRVDNNRLIKTVLLGLVDGNRPCGIPTRRWSDDMVDWCGCCLTEAVQLANDRQFWSGEQSLGSKRLAWTMSWRRRRRSKTEIIASLV